MPPKLPKSLQTLLDKLRLAIRDLMDRFEEGEVNAVGWRNTMKSLLTRFITASFMSGQQSPLIGVTEQGYIFEYIKAQLGFIDNFYLSIVSAAEFQEGWRQRAESYTNSLVAPFWKGETKYLALPAMPGDMTTPCGQLCACLWDIKPVDEAAGDFDCYWLLNAAREITTEHCQVCEARAKLWNPLKIRNWEMVIPKGASSKELAEFIQEALKGGEGSGNFGHAGRPGEVGGSASKITDYEVYNDWLTPELNKQFWNELVDSAKYVSKTNPDVLVTVSPSAEKEGWTRLNFFDKKGIRYHIETENDKFDELLKREVEPRKYIRLIIKNKIDGKYPSKDLAPKSIWNTLPSAFGGEKVFIGNTMDIASLSGRLKRVGYDFDLKKVPENVEKYKEFSLKYSPDQPRDEDGRWTDNPHGNVEHGLTGAIGKIAGYYRNILMPPQFDEFMRALNNKDISPGTRKYWIDKFLQRAEDALYDEDITEDEYTEIVKSLSNAT